MMKKLHLYLVLLLAAETVAEAQTYPTTFWSDLADTSWYDAAQDEFTLTSAETLAGLSQLVADGNSFEGKTILIGADIDLDGNLWSPIGVEFNIPFSGTVNGNDYKISNVWVNMPSIPMAGLFGHTDGASFSNINLDTAYIIGEDNTGALVANLYNGGSIINCSAINVDVTGEYTTGGLVGGFLTNSSISKSYSIGSVNGFAQVGGLAGTGWDNVTVTECYSEGTVTAEVLTGGLIGSFPFAFSGQSVVDNSYSRAAVVSLMDRAGGLIGGGDNALLIKNSYATGTVTAPDSAGAIIGLWGGINAENMYFDSESSGMTEGVGVIQGPPVTPDITAKTTSEMKSTELVDLLNAGSSAAPWSIDQNTNDGYPILNAVLSVQENDLAAAAVKVYPTIFETSFTVSSTVGLESYNIYNLAGALISKGTLINTVSTVSAGNLTAGTYILAIQTTEGKISKKIIKK
ncbi:T9SS type A sorting domain-containing protein [Aequorivita sp. SDUM287046]|uniref:T9SS type A sorting domain-containing protein n=1 Tax=Aequorivita aurantiaca TaxID=3053356 RepID=A0ABT8DDU8_9FLAO|nr:T9SS type A sorting domain-containing protein [Aequorivita aurantiaca]MDN3723258.1 T9SS type A sorting domain-containing protein [Aequorivita aurantiaca]